MPALARLAVHHVRVPLRRRVSHASHSRRSNDTLLVRAELIDGRVGWGEGLPRPYVTGETIDTCLSLTDSLAGSLWESWDSPAELAARLHGPFLPVEEPRPGFGNTVRCAVETALFAAAGSDPAGFLKDRDSSFEVPRRVRYGAVIATRKPWKRRAQALAFRAYGFRDVKVKLGFGDDEAAAKAVRRWCGPRVRLRADANEAWAPAEVPAKCRMLAGLGYESVEQPVPRGAETELPPFAPAGGGLELPVVWDESVCSPADAERLIAHDPGCRFNLRLSKNGGLLRLWDVARLAAEAGVSCQLGCMVGETGVLSGAGRWLAGRPVPGHPWTWLEGGFGRHLVREPFTAEDFTFGPGGHAPLDPAAGYPGVTVDEAAVAAATVAVRARGA